MVKLCGDAIAHKTERGLVRLRLGDAGAVEQAAAELLAAGHARRRRRCRCSSPRWSSGNRELIAGVVRDPQFGPNVMLGVGGILAEAIADVVFRPVPISAVDAAEMIDELATQQLLGEFRGEAAVDRDACSSVLARPVGRWRWPGPTSPASTSTRSSCAPTACPSRSTPSSRSAIPPTPGTSGSGRARPTDEQFRALFEPKGVVVTGASTHPGKFGFVSLHNILASGYQGGVYGTNLQGEEVLGIQHGRRHRRAARRRDRPRLRLHPGRGQPRPAAGLRRARA